jgi:hypothetical protein
VLFRGHIAKHRGPIPTDLCRADRAGDVIVSRSNVRNEGAERIKGCTNQALEKVEGRRCGIHLERLDPDRALGRHSRRLCGAEIYTSKDRC